MLFTDFETRSTQELGGPNSVGVYNYATHPRTEPLMLSWAPSWTDPVEVWQMRLNPMPSLLREKLENPNEEIVSFNSTFERYIFNFKLGFNLPIHRFQDPQASARYLSLPGDLEEVSSILGLPQEYGKAKRGKALIQLFCKPHKLTKKKKGEEAVWGFFDWNSHPQEWEEFVEYCRQDTVAEREVLRREKALGVWPLPPTERKVWEMDQLINDRGIPVDRQFVTNAYALASREKAEKIAENNALTGLENSNSNTQLLSWALDQGYLGLDENDATKYSLEKDVVKSQLKKNKDLTPLCIQVMKNRQSASSTSYKKMAAILRQISVDDRVHNQFVFMGSARCARWAGAGLQFHNMARPIEMFEDEDTVNEARDMIYRMDYQGIKDRFIDPDTGKSLGVLMTVKSNVRTAFVVKDGKRFNVSDLNAIETRVGAWVAQCGPLLDVFAQNKDPYIDFAEKMYQIPYDIIKRDIKSKDPKTKAAAKKLRQIAKPGVLGCFGADTRVLTNRGWVRIVEVASADLLFDGIEWVSHERVLDKGIKNVIDLNGVKVTPDHEILMGEKNWRSAWDVSQNTQLGKQAIDLASGLLSAVNFTGSTTISVSAQGAKNKKQSSNKIWNSEKQRLVNNALATKCSKRKTGSTSGSPNIPEKLLTDWQTDTTPFYPAVGERAVPYIATLVGVFLVHLLPSTNLWSMFLPSQTSTTQSIKLTEKTTTEIMKKEIFVSLLHRSIIAIKRSIAILSTKAKNTVLPNFGKNLLPNIETLGMLLVPSGKEVRPNKSSQINLGAEVRTYDILNSGPRNRFMIATDKGPMIVHNCVYRMSGKTLQVYAEGYGVFLTLEEAEGIVHVFREAYKEITQMWFKLEEAIEEVMKGDRTVRYVGPNDCIKIDKFVFNCNGTDRTILRIHLPSGRRLHYMDATWEPTLMPWKDRVTGEDVYRDALNYAAQDQKTKQWGYTTSHGGKVFENIVQGIARDVLALKMLMFEEAGLPVVLHVHDEAGAETDDDLFAPGLAEMTHIMAQPVEWAPGLPLDSDGFEGTYYHK